MMKLILLLTALFFAFHTKANSENFYCKEKLNSLNTLWEKNEKGDLMYTLEIMYKFTAISTENNTTAGCHFLHRMSTIMVETIEKAENDEENSISDQDITDFRCLRKMAEIELLDAKFNDKKGFKEDCHHLINEYNFHQIMELTPENQSTN